MSNDNGGLGFLDCHSEERDCAIGSLESNVGVLRGQWKGEKGKIEVICFGTAFAISPRVIISCAHSIFLQRKGRLCTSFTFVPGICKGKITSTKMIYKCAPINFLQYEPLKEGQSYAKRPIEEDITLLYLQRPLSLNAYPQVGVEEREFIDIEQKISISGYPSSSFYKCVNIFDAVFERVTLTGHILEINENVVYHNLKTSVGHSGSVILSSNIYEEPVVLGIHTHKGSRRNSGIFLSRKVIERLIRYEINFALQHSEYKLAIKFPALLRDSILDTLDGETLETILSLEQYSSRKILVPQPDMSDIADILTNEEVKYKNSNGQVALINKFEGFLVTNMKFLGQIKLSSETNETIACYLRLNKLFLEALRSMLGQQSLEQKNLKNPSKYLLSFTSLELGLQKELNSLRQVKKRLSKEPQLKLSTVTNHLKQIGRAIYIKNGTISEEESVEKQQERKYLDQFQDEKIWQNYDGKVISLQSLKYVKAALVPNKISVEQLCYSQAGQCCSKIAKSDSFLIGAKLHLRSYSALYQAEWAEWQYPSQGQKFVLSDLDEVDRKSQ